MAEHPPERQVEILLEELSRYKPELLDRPRLVVGSRADLADAERFDGAELTISSVTGEGLAALTSRLAVLVRQERDALPRPLLAPVVHRPEPEGFAIERQGGGFVLSGRDIERAVAVSDLDDPDALIYVQRRLRRMGVDRALRRAGARDGDTVRIGDLSFEWSPDT